MGDYGSHSHSYHHLLRRWWWPVLCGDMWRIYLFSKNKSQFYILIRRFFSGKEDIFRWFVVQWFFKSMYLLEQWKGWSGFCKSEWSLGIFQVTPGFTVDVGKARRKAVLFNKQGEDASRCKKNIEDTAKPTSSMIHIQSIQTGHAQKRGSFALSLLLNDSDWWCQSLFWMKIGFKPPTVWNHRLHWAVIAFSKIIYIARACVERCWKFDPGDMLSFHCFAISLFCNTTNTVDLETVPADPLPLGCRVGRRIRQRGRHPSGSNRQSALEPVLDILMICSGGLYQIIWYYNHLQPW